MKEKKTTSRNFFTGTITTKTIRTYTPTKMATFRIPKEEGEAEGEGHDHPNLPKWGMRPGDMFLLWAQQWYYISRALTLGYSVLRSDTDVYFAEDPYPILHGPLLRPFDMVVQQDFGGPLGGRPSGREQGARHVCAPPEPVGAFLPTVLPARTVPPFHPLYRDDELFMRFVPPGVASSFAEFGIILPSASRMFFAHTSPGS